MTNWMMLSPLESDATVKGVVLKVPLSLPKPTNDKEFCLKTMTLFVNVSALKTVCPSASLIDVLMGRLVFKNVWTLISKYSLRE